MPRFISIGLFFLFVFFLAHPTYAEKIDSGNAFAARDHLDISHLIIKDFSLDRQIHDFTNDGLCLHPPIAIEGFLNNTHLSMADTPPAQDVAKPESEPETEAPASLPTPSPDNEQKPSFPLGLAYESNNTALRAIDRSVSLFSEKMRERFSTWLERSARYVQIMKDVFNEKEMPTELVFLPLIESGFNLNAYSRARAVGPWQFIESTAKRYGLIVDWWRDERKDPVKSTIAAADYLKDLYRMFGSWELALAAYNAGEGRISRALKRTYAGDYWGLLKTTQIKAETKNYVPHYMAAAMIAKTPEDFGFHYLDYHEPLKYEEITLHHPIDIEVIARCANTTVDEIRQLNAELRRWSTPPHLPHYTIKVPAQSKESFMLNLEQIPHDERFSYDVYKVKKGGNIKQIAAKLKVPIIAILHLNSFTGLENLKAGDVIKVPPKDKYFADIDDKMSVKKVSAKKKVEKNTSGKNAKNKKRSAKESKPSSKTKKI
jgi:membrane-bound lytic murein transglycosylase D